MLSTVELVSVSSASTPGSTPGIASARLAVLDLVLAAGPALHRPDQGECAREPEEGPDGEGGDVARDRGARW